MVNQDNAHIEKYLDYYLFNAECSNFSKDILVQRRKVDYAVLITGGWGSGKTYFIESYLNERKANIISKDLYERPFEIIKISLFGISAEEEINELIFEELYKIIGKSAFKKAVKGSLKAMSVLHSCLNVIPDPTGTIATAKVATGILNNVASLADDILDGKLDDFKNNPRNIIVVFDDVERCAMPKPILLGYLNRCVEYLHVPCILIADDRIWNEAEKLQKDASTLHSMASTQEKVVGARFKIKTRPETVIDELLAVNDCDKETVHAKCCLILQKFKTDIIEILDYFNVYNYRTLKHTFVEFEHFYSFFPKEKKFSPWEKDEMARAIVTDFVVTVYCHMLGVFKYDDENINHAFDDDWKMALYLAEAKEKRNDKSAEGAEEEVKKLIEELKEKFEKVGMSLSLPFISQSYGDYSKKWHDIWKRWLKEESVDENYLRETIENSIWFKFNNETKRNNMLRYAFLSRKDADEAWMAFNEALDEEMITRPNEIFSFYHTLLWYADNGLLPYSSQDFETKMFDYLDRVKDKLEKEKLYSDSDIREYNSTYDAEKCKKFKEKLVLMIEEKYGKDTGLSLKTLLEMLISEEEGKRISAEGILSEDFADQHILLDESDADVLVDFYKEHEVDEMKKIHRIFEKRFSKGILLESDFVTKTLERIDSLFGEDKKGKPLPPNVWCLFYLKRVLKNALEKEAKDNQELENAGKQMEQMINDLDGVNDKTPKGE